MDNWQNEQSGRNWPVFDELDDVDAPINNVVATVQIIGTEAQVTLEHNLREFVRYEMSEDEHTELATALHSAKGKVAISGYRCDLMDTLYDGWKIQEAPEKICHSVKEPRQEALWTNY